MPSRRAAPVVPLICLLGLGGCTAIKPEPLAAPAPASPATFSHAALDRVVERFVDDEGRVDYGALKRDPRDLENYYRLVATYGPHSHPRLFPTERDELAYWINAYNAAVIKTVLTYYPIDGVASVSLFGKVGFFLFQRPQFGGRRTSLYELEHGVIRKRFADPRLHFALNCASRGCPRLPREAFTAEQLDAQLDREARRFFAEARNLRIDHERRAVYLSSIMDWYEDDFTSWYRARFGHRGTLLDYARLYVRRERAAELSQATRYDVRFVPYDWRLNDQMPRDAHALPP